MRTTVSELGPQLTLEELGGHRVFGLAAYAREPGSPRPEGGPAAGLAHMPAPPRGRAGLGSAGGHCVAWHDDAVQPVAGHV